MANIKSAKKRILVNKTKKANNVPKKSSMKTAVKAAVAKKAIPNCNIQFIEGAEMKDTVSGYLQTLFDQNPKAVGGAMPTDEFYYAR